MELKIFPRLIEGTPQKGHGSRLGAALVVLAIARLPSDLLGAAQLFDQRRQT